MDSRSQDLSHELEQPFAPRMETRARVSVLRDQLAHGRLARAAVIGLGKSGRSAARLLRKHGVEVACFDDRSATDSEFESRPLDSAAIDDSDLVVLSPGVPRTRPELAKVIDRGKLVGEIELASWFVRAPMVGITGTNGKSTTTALTAHLLRATGKKVFAGGNLGEPLSELALSEDPVDVAVVELSSFQLESIVEATFEVACWLNLTPDHLDRYRDADAYSAAKRRIIERRSIRGTAVLNALDDHCRLAGVVLGGPVRWFAAADANDLAEASGTRFRGQLLVRVKDGTEETYRVDSPSLLGRHNLANAAAALECARHFDAAPQALRHGLADFRGLPHRLELIRSLDGVTWYNDSKATNIDSAVIALEALAAPTILIAGGKDKGASWAPLVQAGRGKLKAVLAIGAATPLVLAAFGPHVLTEDCGTLEVAVARARALAVAGDVVALSPACASYDQFQHYEHRGQVFRQLVESL